jgi:hypothetical protein
MGYHMKLSALFAGQVYFARKSSFARKQQQNSADTPQEEQKTLKSTPSPPKGPSWLKQMALWSAGLGTLLSGFGLTRDHDSHYQQDYTVQVIPEKPVASVGTNAFNQDQVSGVINVSRRYDLKDDPMVSIQYQLHYSFEAGKMPLSLEELEVAQAQLEVENADSPLLQLNPKQKTQLLMQKALEYRIRNTFEETLRWQLREVSSTELGENGEGLLVKLRAGFVEEDYIDFQQIVQIKGLNFGDGVKLNEVKLIQVQKEDETGKKLLISNLTL